MEELSSKITVNKPLDFEEKWNQWLKEVHEVKNNIEIVKTEEVSFGKEIHFYFDSVSNTKIYAVLYLPKNPKAIVSYYHGFNSSILDERNIWHCHNLVNDNLAVVAIDMRFQSDRVFDNNDYSFKDLSSTLYSIDDLENCLIKRLDQDALKIIDIIKDENCFPEISKLPLIVAGPSQGGGMSLLVGAFSKVDLIVCDIPSDCCMIERINGKHGKYGVITSFLENRPLLKEVVLNNVLYFDVVNMANLIKAPVFSSVGLKDEICPARFFMVAYELITSKKHIEIYENHGHGGFEDEHIIKKIAFINQFLSNYSF